MSLPKLNFKRPKSQLERMILVNFLATLVGIISAYSAIGFRGMIGYLQNLFFFGRFDFHLTSPTEHILGNYIILLPCFGLLIVSIIVKKYASEAKGHGVPEVIEAVRFKGGIIRKRVVAIKAIASSLTIASGGSVGREGPIVQIGSAIGSTLGQMFKVNERLIRVLIGCGAASAISATFNTPIAGVIFAIEVIVLEFKTDSFIPLVISSVFSCVIARSILGSDPEFILPAYTLVDPKELGFYLVLGLLAGSVGAFTISFLYKIEDIFDKAPVHYTIKAMFGGLILGIIGLNLPQLFGVGYETVGEALNGKLELQLMITLVVFKILAMSVTLGAGGSGGVFAPSLFIGAMLGGSYGAIVHQLAPSITANYGAYALVGMAAVFSATSRATFTAIVILFEMTLDYSIILPLMFACVIADQVSVLISKNSIYSVKIRRKGLPFVNGFGVNILAVTSTKSIMTKKIIAITSGMSILEAKDICTQSPHSIYPVINNQGILKGQIKSEDILNVSEENSHENVMGKVHDAPLCTGPNSTLINALKKLETNDEIRDPRIFVTDQKSNKLLGIIGPSDYLKISKKELE